MSSWKACKLLKGREGKKEMPLTFLLIKEMTNFLAIEKMISLVLLPFENYLFQVTNDAYTN